MTQLEIIFGNRKRSLINFEILISNCITNSNIVCPCFLEFRLINVHKTDLAYNVKKDCLDGVMQKERVLSERKKIKKELFLVREIF